MSDPIRWLHLSDFHVGKDDWAQWRLFEKIIEHVADQKGKGFIPDLVFITGDIANAGQKSEYNEFRSGFLAPLHDALGGKDWRGTLYAVPGNHDVDRSKNSHLDRASTNSPGGHFFDPTQEGKGNRDIVSPRFKQYRQSSVGKVPGNWIHEPSGAFAETSEIHGLRVGVVGINTAWLSMDHEDSGKLTPGIALVEAALNKIKPSDLRIVLGHHPLHWLIEDEAPRLRALFGHHKVIYLHGHLHRAEGRQEEGAGEPFLVFQSGAAFQARDDEPWKNGLLWGEVDWQRGELRLSPRYWNPEHYDWPPESGRFPENRRVPGSDYWWSWPLPGVQHAGAGRTPAWQAPPGWQVLDAAALEAHGREITAEEAARFFDGAEPDWSLALCPTLPRRAVVGRLAERIAAYGGLERPHVTLLIGPGGEGKSMALRQAVITLLERVPRLRVLWRQDDSCGITAEQLLTLPKVDAPWLVATDAADLIAKPLHRGVQILKGAGRGDLRFLLAGRDSDWRAGGASRLDWRPIADYHAEQLSGLTREDAEAITRAWVSFGDTGLGEAVGQDGRDLAQQLHEAALADAAVGEGALLGGMLAVRVGAGLRGHVMSLMERLSDTKLPSGGSLYTAFAYSPSCTPRVWISSPARCSPRRSAVLGRHCKRM